MIMQGIPHINSLSGRLFSGVLLIFSVAMAVFYLAAPDVFAADIALIEPHVLQRTPGGWVVLDARPKKEWLAGHIPGAISFSWEDYTRTDEQGVPFRVWPPQELATALGKLGINEKSPVVIYGDADKSWGGEGWNCWVLSWLGHKGPVRILNGGIQAWKKNRFPVSAGQETVNARPVQYRPTLNDSLDISTNELEKKKAGLVVIDTRSTLEWLRGHIPGAMHINWEEFYSGKERTPLSPDAFRVVLRKHGVDVNKPVVYYCTGGIRSAYVWMVHQLSGLPAARNYEGGYEAWSRRAK
jgi:thiosulfate/3-mercaptopyruvate sulfurtransferase